MVVWRHSFGWGQQSAPSSQHACSSFLSTRYQGLNLATFVVLCFTFFTPNLLRLNLPPRFPPPTLPILSTFSQLPNYASSPYSAFETFSIFFGALSVIVFPSLYLILNRTSVTPRNKAVFIWFVVCACIHLVFEGYFAYFHATMPEDDNIFAQLWKEYSLSDSRYLTSDPLVVCMERITAVSIGIKTGKRVCLFEN